MGLAYKIVKDLVGLNRNFCSADYDYSLQYLQEILPFKKIRYENDPSRNNGWVVPPKWDLKGAQIKYNGKIILDATQHPLQVISLSSSMTGKVALGELKEHLYWETPMNSDEDAIPFHFRQNYQSWSRDWGFCVSKKFYDSLKEGEYEILIDTHESEGYLDILEYTHEGKLQDCYYFIAHLDHPGMANDDLSGVAVGIELFNKLTSLKTKFTYKLIVVQEIIGSQYYLKNIDRSKILGGLFLEMLGTKSEFGLQKSFCGESPIDHLLRNTLKKNQVKHKVEGFGEIIGNDEIVFESFGIPCSSISRFPYPEYHTNKDSINIIDKNALDESINIIFEFILQLDEQKIVTRLYEGIPCLSNPDINLYIDVGQFKNTNVELFKWRKLMDAMSFLTQSTTIYQLSEKYQIPINEVEDYLQKWQDKGLVSII